MNIFLDNNIHPVYVWKKCTEVCLFILIRQEKRKKKYIYIYLYFVFEKNAFLFLIHKNLKLQRTITLIQKVGNRISN